jgi:replicative DNA helicase
MADHDLADPDRSEASDAEAALLGAAMVYPTRAAEILDDLTCEDLGSPSHRAVLDAIRAVLATGTDPEPVLVHAAFRDNLHYNAAVKRFAIVVHDCLSAAATPTTAPAVRHAVITARWRRTALTAAARIAEAAEHAPAGELHHALNESLTDLGAILARLAPAPEATSTTHITATAPGPVAA